MCIWEKIISIYLKQMDNAIWWEIDIQKYIVSSTTINFFKLKCVFISPNRINEK